MDTLETYHRALAAMRFGRSRSGLNRLKPAQGVLTAGCMAYFHETDINQLAGAVRFGPTV
jgi:hypothetical protein